VTLKPLFSFLAVAADAKHDDWQKVFSVNVEGYANMVQACFPYMRNRGKAAPGWSCSMASGVCSWCRLPIFSRFALKRGARSFAVFTAGKNRASVVNLCSASAHVAQPNRWTYSASKGAVHTLTKCMALDLSPHGIRVNAVSPGWIWTQQVGGAYSGAGFRRPAAQLACPANTSRRMNDSVIRIHRMNSTRKRSYDRIVHAVLAFAS